MDISDIIFSAYPNARDCLEGHLGPSLLRWHNELDDDRTRLMVITYCKHCGMPNGADMYATEQDQADYYAGKQPAARLVTA